MLVFVGLMLTVVVFSFVTYPLLVRKETPVFTNGDKMAKMRSRLDSESAVLNRIEMDYRSGNLNEEDYRDMQSRQLTKIEHLKKEIDLYHRKTAIDHEIEIEVRKLHRHRNVS